MGYIVYANWVGIHRWGMTGHQKIEAIRQHAFAHDKIDYLPDDPEQVSQLRKSSRRCDGMSAWGQLFCSL